MFIISFSIRHVQRVICCFFTALQARDSVVYVHFLLFHFSSPWDARIFFIRSCRLSSNPYLIPLYVSILPRISMSLPFESWISSHHLDALVTDSVANLIPRTLSLVSCPIGNNEGRYGSGHREWQDMQFIMSLLTCHVGSVVGHSQS